MCGRCACAHGFMMSYRLCMKLDTCSPANGNAVQQQESMRQHSMREKLDRLPGTIRSGGSAAFLFGVLASLLQVVEGGAQAVVARVAVGTPTPHAWLTLSWPYEMSLAILFHGYTVIHYSLPCWMTIGCPAPVCLLMATINIDTTAGIASPLAFNLNSSKGVNIRSIHAAEAIQLILQRSAALGFCLKRHS